LATIDDNRADTPQTPIDLAAGFRVAARLNLHEGVCNHFSVMLAGRRFLINPQWLHLLRMTASRLLLTDEHGRTIADHRLQYPHAHPRGFAVIAVRQSRETPTQAQR